jgi:hypothetical protein
LDEAQVHLNSDHQAPRNPICLVSGPELRLTTASNSTGGPTGTTDSADYFWTSFDGGRARDAVKPGGYSALQPNDALFVDGFDD